jgi:hypothetical protein
VAGKNRVGLGIYMQDLLNQYLLEYRTLWGRFTVERNLPMDPDMWDQKDQDDWYGISDDLNKKIDALRAERDNLPLDERHPNDWYIIDISIDSHDGPDSEEVDVRSLSLEQLKDLCSVFPRYNEYYFAKLANSL